MIIGFDASRAFVKNPTGTENYSHQILTHLFQIDHYNKYLVYARGRQITDFQLPSNFQIKPLPYPKLWTQVGLALQTFKDSLGILFVPAHILPLIRKPGLKTVVTAHDLGAEYLPTMHQLKQRLYLNLMTHYQLHSATHIIAVSQATKKDLVKRAGIDPEKITVIYEGYNEKLFKPIKGEKLNKKLSNYKLKPQNYFLSVGTIQPRKNLERLIEAFSHQLSARFAESRRAIRQKNQKSDDRRLTTDNYLVIVGQKGWLSDEIYKLPAKLGIDDRVKFLGYVPDEYMPALYSGAQALLFPSLFEGFGLPILEAMACGCPVLTSQISSMPEVVGKAAIVVNPYSIDSITQGILKTYDSPQTIHLIKEGFQQIKKFSWHKAAQETLEVLEKAASKT